MNLSKKEEIHWCKGKVDSVNPMQLKRKMIGPAGQVTELSLANGKAEIRMIGNAYAQLKLYEKPLRGWVDYYECGTCAPVGALEERPDGDEHLGLCEGCAKREILIRTRMEAKHASNAEYESMFMDKLDKLAEIIKAKTVGDVVPRVDPADLAEVMTAGHGKRGKREG